MFDLVIIGGGPAGVAAAVYAARKRLSTLLITKTFGGQSIVSEDIYNWIGEPSISGKALAERLEAHARAYETETLAIATNTLVLRVEKMAGGFRVRTEEGQTHETRAVLLATGASRRRLEVPGADTFEHKGLTYCASCDGPVFSGLDVAVIGGGNAGFETAAQLLAYVKSVTLLDINETFKAEPITVEKVLAHKHMCAIPNARTKEIRGGEGGMVSGLVYEDMKSKEVHELAVAGVFVEIGMLPNTASVDDLVALDEVKRVKVNCKNQRTSVEGIWAAGDCTDELYHQNNIAAGDGVKALEDAYLWLKTR